MSIGRVVAFDIMVILKEITIEFWCATTEGVEVWSNIGWCAATKDVEVQNDIGWRATAKGVEVWNDKGKHLLPFFSISIF